MSGISVLMVANIAFVVMNLYFAEKNAANAKRNLDRCREILGIEELDDLRCALSDWAHKYREAKPTGRYLKRREADLFAACEKVGLTWLRPEHRPKWKEVK